jgi:hypothetical protein
MCDITISNTEKKYLVKFLQDKASYYQSVSADIYEKRNFNKDHRLVNDLLFKLDTGEGNE